MSTRQPSLKLVGYWASANDSSGYPHPRDFVEPGWKAAIKHKIVNYLRSGVFFRGFWGFDECLLDEKREPRDMGSKELTDGVYLWPEGLAVYVSDYDVRIPEEFCEHMVNSDFKIPQLELLESKPSIDCQFWKTWAADNRHS